MKKLKNISKLINLMSQHYTNSMDEICVPVIKKILGHYLELNPNYNNGLKYILKGTLIVFVSVPVIAQQLVWIQNYSFGCFLWLLVNVFLIWSIYKYPIE